MNRGGVIKQGWTINNYRPCIFDLKCFIVEFIAFLIYNDPLIKTFPAAVSYRKQPKRPLLCTSKKKEIIIYRVNPFDCHKKK